ncbi:DUF1990 domain-containing protein [Amycolatopsis cynarae]|uniref:DUF1990 domain-containing protein n=1 Tax=Amycolatopsis cynarae TaxID=2995223 RepID=A0ABY7B927_9PSEU|nr:DUF1990 domain-containing protein [Amycolatopsis sp. HUAS 11-8]WAL68444.1 DUF1990 domain-containing protein [Amycolatopsis sp. HUAS 11-8]
MGVRLLPPGQVARLRARQLTYPEVGASEHDPPRGYRALHRTRTLPRNADFTAAAHDLAHWRVQRRAGLRVAASDPEVRPGAVVVLGLLGVKAPCRVISVIDEPDRRGFVYGTLPGHPECGEEAFLLERGVDGRVRFAIRAFSRPAGLLARLAGPLGHWAQDVITRRYLTALG